MNNSARAIAWPLHLGLQPRPQPPRRRCHHHHEAAIPPQKRPPRPLHLGRQPRPQPPPPPPCAAGVPAAAQLWRFPPHHGRLHFYSVSRLLPPPSMHKTIRPDPALTGWQGSPPPPPPSSAGVPAAAKPRPLAPVLPRLFFYATTARPESPLSMYNTNPPSPGMTCLYAHVRDSPRPRPRPRWSYSR